MTPKNPERNRSKSGTALSDIDPVRGVIPHPGKMCGSCTACCAVVPVKELGLKSYQRCPHLKTFPQFPTGCGIYAERPFSCRVWSCLWLATDISDEARPDRCGVIFDPLPDTISAGGREMAAAQAWVLPGFEDAWQDGIVNQMITALVDDGYAVLWRQAPAADGKLWARAFFKDPTTGQDSVSALFEEGPDHGLGDDRARMIRAQQLLAEREQVR